MPTTGEVIKEVLHFFADVGVAVVIVMLKAAAASRDKLRSDVENALTVMKELQAWKLIVDAKIQALENKWKTN